MLRIRDVLHIGSVISGYIGSCLTEMVYRSFTGEYSANPGLVEVSGPKNINFRFCRQKPIKPEVAQKRRDSARTKAHSRFSD